jgi:hypothetical protein
LVCSEARKQISKTKRRLFKLPKNVELPAPLLIAGLRFAFGGPLAAGQQLLSEDVDTIAGSWER